MLKVVRCGSSFHHLSGDALIAPPEAIVADERTGGPGISSRGNVFVHPVTPELMCCGKGLLMLEMAKNIGFGVGAVVITFLASALLQVFLGAPTFNSWPLVATLFALALFLTGLASGRNKSARPFVSALQIWLGSSICILTLVRADWWSECLAVGATYLPVWLGAACFRRGKNTSARNA